MRLPIVLCLLLAASAQGAPITFTDHGRTVKALDELQVRALAPAQDVSVMEPHLGLKVSYRAVPLPAVLDAVYGKAWRQAELLLFECVDGYRPAVPVAKVLANPAFLAFAQTRGGPFHLKNIRQNEEADLGPFYLVWKDSPAIRADGGADWPYQVIGLELTEVAAAFPRLAPPAGASAEAKAGFTVFRRQCFSCHTINGDGGGRGPELNYPLNVTEYWRPEILKQFISAPTTVRFSTNMPPLDPRLTARDQALSQLVAYLAAMKERKLPPAPK